MTLSNSFEFRAVSQEERETFENLVHYVFARSTTGYPVDDPMQNEWTTAVFHKGKLIATSGGYPFKVRLNGKPIDAEGLTDVGTEPGFRRRGIVRELVTRRLRQVHEHENQCVSILWATMAAIYQRFGYGLAATQMSGSFDPRFATMQFPNENDGYVRMVDENEGLPIIRDLYEDFIEDRTMDLHRNDYMWKGHFGSDKARSYCAVYFNESDEPEGYVTYRTSVYRRAEEDGGPSQRLTVREFIYKNVRAYRALWDFIREHDLVGKVEINMPLDDPAWHLLLEPQVLQPTLWDGPWIRVVDVAEALTRRHYAIPGDVVLEIKRDPECPWNERKYLLSTDGTTTEVTETTKSPKVTLSPNGMASLLTGNTSLSLLNRIGRAEVLDEASIPELDALFKTKFHPFCRNGF